MDNTKEVNKKIAELLGFKMYKMKITYIDTKRIDYRYAWDYPSEFEYLRSTHPEYSIPDFISIIHTYCKMIKSGIPKDFWNDCERL